jgi:DNA polymerase/3'-5' exonuclease PolX
MDYNKPVIAYLQEFYDKEDNVFKKNAYRKAIKNLSGVKINTIEDIKDIKGIGAKIKEKIQYAITNFEPAVIEDAIGNIYGIGPAKLKVLKEKGINTFQKLKDALALDPKILNAKQKIGLTYYDDIEKRIPYNEVSAHDKYLHKIILGTAGTIGTDGEAKVPKVAKAPKIPKKAIGPDVPDIPIVPADILSGIEGVQEISIVGSYRREKPTSGDIDLLIKIKDKDNYEGILKKIVKKLEDDNYILEVLACKDKKFMGIVKLKDSNTARRLDMLITFPEEYACALLYFTGSKEHNIKIRNKALKMGYTLNEHRMEKNKTDKPDVPIFNTEKDIFDFLEMEYIKPSLRD